MEVMQVLTTIAKRKFKTSSFHTLGSHLYSSVTTSLNQSSTLKQLKIWAENFKSAHIPEPEESIKHIISAATGVPHYKIGVSDEPLTDEQITQVNMMSECRLARMPVQYIIKNWDFLDLTLFVSPPVFIPRPETEGLVLLAEKYLGSLAEGKFIEIGSGSGPITCSLLKRNSNLNGIAVDRSLMACNLTAKNARFHQLEERLKIINAKLTADGLCSSDGNVIQVEELFDLVISNPPYIPQSDLKNLEPEVKLYEDLRALDGGKDGLAIISDLLLFAPQWLKPGGRLFLEVDHRHPPILRKTFETSNGDYKLELIEIHKDIFGKERFLEFQKK
ncbi:MTRF1L release factor glutamine methyltransferase-like [Artemia franciscana]|uniref:peptide chain release factor N(5)-glutamine methyltransferase n=1 Tax=Artemia franciscana TaxID=6661 RepID=A0AA88I128_ARTSF|nr:hypothetical protein QYM36_006124 [Artemia franciscana]KAK2718999.1 hypothetical protein QYM36_006124 [Artemia franciscana]